ncbi:MAG: HAD family phosphatase [Chloroflexi bacterium]|nr:HAD family phosphatase [Chloroflexota bacterium]
MSGGFRAVVFDLDGVLWDGEPVYYAAFNTVLEPLGHHLPESEYDEIMGLSVEAAWEWVLNRFDISESAEPFYRAYDKAVLEVLKEPIEPLPGVRELVAKLRDRGIRIAVASASLRQWVDATLDGIGLRTEFETTVSASEVEHAKPAPDLYAKAAERLGIPPDECLAVEDTTAGIASAKAAGLFAIQLRAASTALPPIAEADLVIDDYSQFDLSLLDGAE